MSRSLPTPARLARLPVPSPRDVAHVATLPVASTVRTILSGNSTGVTGFIRRMEGPPGDPGWFGPGSACWQVHGSVTTMLGGVRALLVVEHVIGEIGADLQQ